jgi:MFS family permease
LIRPKFFYGYFIVLVAFILEMMSWAVLYTYGVFFKPMLAEFGWSRAVTSGAYSLCFIITGIVAVVVGRLSDKFGPRAILTLCGLLLGTGYFLMSQISAVWQLYLVYGVIIGIGTGAVYTPLLSTLSRWFVKRRGLMTGIAVSGIGFGILFLSPLVTLLIHSYGWRDSYRLMALVVAVVTMLAAQFIKRDPAQIGLRPYGEDELTVNDSGPILSGFSAPRAMSTRQFWTICAMFLCFGFTLQTILVHIVSHATDIGIAPTSAATILSTIGGVSIAGRLALGTTSDRIGNKRATIVCFSLLVLAILWLLIADRLWMFHLFAVIFGFAYGGLISLTSLIVAELFGLVSMGVILGLVTFTYAIGESVGPTLAGKIFDMTGSYQTVFVISAALGLGAIMLATTLKPINPGQQYPCLQVQ